MEDRIKEIRVKADDISDALIYTINMNKVIGGSIEPGKVDNDYALAVLADNFIITASFKDGVCEGFSIAKDNAKPEINAIIVLMAAVSNNNFDSIDIGWNVDTDEFIFTFNKDE